MPREAPLLVQASLQHSLGQRHWQAQLPNGAPCIAHLPESAQGLLTALQASQQVGVILEMTPYDLSRGRIQKICS